MDEAEESMQVAAKVPEDLPEEEPAPPPEIPAPAPSEAPPPPPPQKYRAILCKFVGGGEGLDATTPSSRVTVAH